MDEIPTFKEKVFASAKSKNLGKYVWDIVIAPSLGYSFSDVHGYSYSMIGFQCAYLATYFPSVYWNCACLRIDAGLEDDAGSDYTKLAKAIGNMQAHGISVVPVDINKSGYMFEPDEKDNAILYGFKALNGVNGDAIMQIVDNRPYESFADFQTKTHLDRTVTLSLIKAGAFDSFDDRETIMRQYLSQVCGAKTKLTMQNFKALVDANLLPPELDFQKRLFVFNKALRANCKEGDSYRVENNYYDFYAQFFDIDELDVLDSGSLGVLQKKWQKMYTKAMEPAKAYIADNQGKLLDKLNAILMNEMYDKYAAGTISSWEMESMGYYYHKHELASVRSDWYNICSFKGLPEQPEAEYTFTRNGRDIPIYKTCRIMGTVIGRNNTKATVNILTTDSGVVTLKLDLPTFAQYNRRLCENIGGVSKVMESGWFNKGEKLVVNGFRRGDMFKVKAYRKTPSKQLYRITGVQPNGTMTMTHLRYGETEDGNE